MFEDNPFKERSRNWLVSFTDELCLSDDIKEKSWTLLNTFADVYGRAVFGKKVYVGSAIYLTSIFSDTPKEFQKTQREIGVVMDSVANLVSLRNSITEILEKADSKYVNKRASYPRGTWQMFEEEDVKFKDFIEDLEGGGE